MSSPTTVATRILGKNGRQIPALGFGLMVLSAAYGPAGTDEERFAVLDRAWELGLRNWDSSNHYGDSEDFVGRWFVLHPERRADIFLATKFGVSVKFGPDGKPDIGVNTTPENTRASAERSLKRLGTEWIDLYYISRLDKKTPIEKTIQALAELKSEGKIRAIGISECSERSLRRAYKIAPIDAVQLEYSPWQLDIERESGDPVPGAGLFDACKELDITIFAYSPLGRGFLTGQLRSLDDLPADDSRRRNPRFSPENFPKNIELVEKLQAIAARKGCSPSQLTLAWLMAQGDNIVPIPGTKSSKYLEQNLASLDVALTEEEKREIRDAIETVSVAGHRAPQSGLTEFGDTPEL
ncbi:NADP-dependent oxidoreductase domain-containing protein [Lasiosphaeria hispida]|uniref:NADP-dependent oxidoreductase domain-containing protein n=1 Tax=Lasiosphaeria hispida TaxID=260671 RepID=A0AAJ0HCY7_9PEZI|nr:NADP-dependent oxidoreductase domain-containing protein [Lasiosphaeria hispida]